MRKQIIASLDYTYSTGRLVSFIFTFLGLLGIIILCIIAFINDFSLDQVFLSPFESINMAYAIPGLAAVIIFLIGIIAFLFNLRKRNKIHRLLKNGTRQEAHVISSVQDFHVTMNGTPRRIVKFKTPDGKIYTFKSFDFGLVPHLTENKVIPIIHNEKGDVFPDPDFVIRQIKNNQ